MNPAATANYMCELASVHRIACSVVANAGKHDFNNAGATFAAALPWLGGRLGTPGVPRIPLPGVSAG